MVGGQAGLYSSVVRELPARKRTALPSVTIASHGGIRREFAAVVGHGLRQPAFSSLGDGAGVCSADASRF